MVSARIFHSKNTCSSPNPFLSLSRFLFEAIIFFLHCLSTSVLRFPFQAENETRWRRTNGNKMAPKQICGFVWPKVIHGKKNERFSRLFLSRCIESQPLSPHLHVFTEQVILLLPNRRVHSIEMSYSATVSYLRLTPQTFTEGNPNVLLFYSHTQSYQYCTQETKSKWEELGVRFTQYLQRWLRQFTDFQVTDAIFSNLFPAPFSISNWEFAFPKLEKFTKFESSEHLFQMYKVSNSTQMYSTDYLSTPQRTNSLWTVSIREMLLHMDNVAWNSRRSM